MFSFNTGGREGGREGERERERERERFTDVAGVNAIHLIEMGGGPYLVVGSIGRNRICGLYLVVGSVGRNRL